ncbi:MAG: hypothetical protein PVF94_08435 [Desulfobacterales bacterium]|jgi:hypothetical protein
MQKEMKGTYRWIGLCVGILSLVYFLNTALKQISSFPQINWNLIALINFLGAIILSAIVILIGAYSWFLLLRYSGEPANTIDVLVIFSLAQFARYIPGNITHHVGRIALSKLRGFEIPRVLFTMALEIGWLIVAASILALFWLMFMSNSLFRYASVLPSVFQLFIVISIAIAIPLFAKRILINWRPGHLKKLFGHANVNTPPSSILICCLFLYISSFVLMGIAADILARGLFCVTDHHVSLLTGTFAIAWVAGFLAPGAPAGLGVREVILLKILDHFYGTGVAAGITISLRVITLIADCLIFSMALMVKQKLTIFPDAVLEKK